MLRSTLQDEIIRNHQSFANTYNVTQLSSTTVQMPALVKIKHKQHKSVTD
jgi:hypothetical protein